jgi:hypothetical protein
VAAAPIPQSAAASKTRCLLHSKAPSLTQGFCSSATVEQQAAAGSPDPLRLPSQYSFPGKEFPSL